MTHTEKIYDCIIIGAGAAGLFCSAMMPQPADGLILEKTPRPGTKLLMSGSGQCNITHAGSIKDFISCYGKNGGKVRSSLYKYSNISLVEILESNGVPTVTREDGKIFPASMDAHDVLDLLLRRTKQNGFEIRYNSEVTTIEQLSEEAAASDSGTEEPSGALADKTSHSVASARWRVTAGDRMYMARNLVIAIGGCSYPTSGSDGSLFKVLKRDLGIKITPLKPALSAIKPEEYPYADLSGISFDNAHISIWHDNKKAAENIGPLLLTHQDFSGPAVMNISKYAENGDIIRINYLYPLDNQQALSLLKQAAHGNKGSLAGIISSEFDLPKRFSQLLTSRYGESLKTLAAQLTGEAFTIRSAGGWNKAMATSGGIDLSQINPTTMEFRKLPGLFAIGEALDVDGITGGYNLQFAYSSGCAAATALCR